MNEHTIEQLINTLWEMIDEAKAVPLTADKCIIDRDKALDILDEIKAGFPNEIKMSKEIVEKRNNYIESGKREAESIKKQAEEYAKRCVNENDITAEAKRKAQDLTLAAEKNSKELMKAASDYCDDAMKRTEEAIAKALEELRTSRAQFIKASRERK